MESGDFPIFALLLERPGLDVLNQDFFLLGFFIVSGHDVQESDLGMGLVGELNRDVRHLGFDIIIIIEEQQGLFSAGGDRLG